MKKYIIIAILLLASVSWAGCKDDVCKHDPIQLARMNAYVLGAGRIACAAQQLGWKTGASPGTVQIGEIVQVIPPAAVTFSSPCTGALSKAYVGHYSTGSGNVKACIHLVSDNSVVACSEPITGGVDGIREAVISGTLVSGTAYKIVLASDDGNAGTWTYYYTANTATFSGSTDCTTYYDNSGIDLDSCTFGSNANRRPVVYFDVN